MRVVYKYLIGCYLNFCAVEDTSFATNLRIGAIVIDIPRVPIGGERSSSDRPSRSKSKYEKGGVHL